MIDGIININKPADWTSHDVCAKLRNRLKIKKIGHTGTLDPMATGVLPVCIGNATRIIEYYDKDKKTYHASMKLGISTDTLDITGEVLETASYANVTENAVIEAFKAYTGVIKQVPPKYSALKIDGKRAYDLARAGKDFEIKAREIEIFRNEITRLDIEKGEIEFDVTCSKGTYIRTICDDIGHALGCGGTMTSLTRTASGAFKIEDSVDIEELCAMSDEEILKHIIPLHANGGLQASVATIATPANAPTAMPTTMVTSEGSSDRAISTVADTLIELGTIILNDKRVAAFSNGCSSYLRSCRIVEESHFNNIYKVYSSGVTLQLLGIGMIEGESLKPVKVIAK